MPQSSTSSSSSKLLAAAAAAMKEEEEKYTERLAGFNLYRTPSPQAEDAAARIRPSFWSSWHRQTDRGKCMV